MLALFVSWLRQSANPFFSSVSDSESVCSFREAQHYRENVPYLDLNRTDD